MGLADYLPPDVLARLREQPGRMMSVRDERTGKVVGVMGVVAQEGGLRGRVNGVQVENHEGRMSAVVECEGIRETVDLRGYGLSPSEVEELKRLITRGRPRRVTGPGLRPSGLVVPNGVRHGARRGEGGSGEGPLPG